jgi:fatty-acid peroxygenase
MEPGRDRLPRLPGFDKTLALRREGYLFISRRCDRLGTDGFRTRLMLRDVVCLRGPDASALLYGDEGVTRVGAMPKSTLWLLQDRGSVQQLDGAAHRRRKEMFIHLLMPPESVAELVAEFHAAWLRALPRWSEKPDLPLIDAVNPVLTRAICRWTGLDLTEAQENRLAATLYAMSDRRGGIGPLTWIALARRAAVEAWLRRIVRQVRRGKRIPVPGSPLEMIARACDTKGVMIPAEAAAVELLNILRPVVAVGRYITFAALALHRAPDWMERFRAGDHARLFPFVEEVRRQSPFFPFVGAVTTRPMDWRGTKLPRGQWLLFDIYGSLHDPRRFPDPDSLRPGRGLSWRDQDHHFVPQGGGRVETSHRCPGERITVALMAEAVRLLTTAMDYDVPEQDLRVRLDRVPARPADGFRIANVRERALLPPA